MGTTATIQARAGERNGCIKVRFLGRSYYPILNEYLRRKNLPEKILDFWIPIYEIYNYKICMGGTYMYVCNRSYK